MKVIPTINTLKKRTMDDIARFNESTPKVFVLESWGI
jgi:hypothetical protein